MMCLENSNCDLRLFFDDIVLEDTFQRIVFYGRINLTFPRVGKASNEFTVTE